MPILTHFFFKWGNEMSSCLLVFNGQQADILLFSVQAISNYKHSNKFDIPSILSYKPKNHEFMQPVRKHIN